LNSSKTNKVTVNPIIFETITNWILGENIFSYPYFSWYYKGAKFPKIKKLGKADTVISLIRLKGKSEA